VLVVDDDPGFVRFVRRLLEARGVASRGAGSLAEALALLRSAEGEGVDVVLCDLLLPGGSGWELQAELARGGHPLAERVLFCTADILGPRVAAAREAGAPLILEKPFAEEDLLASLERLAASREETQA
jgi:CheY-like chemotaxis protein